LALNGTCTAPDQGRDARPVRGRVTSFEVALQPPDVAPWRMGNTGVPGFTRLDSGRAGPHALIVALIHGNEIAGAIALDRLLRDGFHPARGQLTLGFANLAAFARFDPAEPTASRFLDEDLNRVWDQAVLDGPRRSRELDRAREMRPLIEGADALLDLHSMLWPSDSLILSGATEKGRRLAAGIGTPALVVSDRGHAAGPRLLDYGPFADPALPAAACLAECGQHWAEETVVTAGRCIQGFLRLLGMLDDRRRVPKCTSKVAEVTLVVTAATSGFAFLQPFRGGDVIARRNTLIALDGDAEIRTPHDDCLLVMPSLRPVRGHTAVRLARFVEPDP
jgi:predicted deacylase